MELSDARLRSLQTARRCAALGACQRTIAHLTGLTTGYILRAAFNEAHPAPRGRPSYCEEFVLDSNIQTQAEVSLFAARYRRLAREQFAPDEALLAAYQHHISTFPASTLSFDAAFFVVARLDGIWASRSRLLDLVTCTRCGNDHVVAIGSNPSGSCPICRTYPLDLAPRQAPSGPASAAHAAATPWRYAAVVNGELGLDRDISRARLRRALSAQGASSKVIAVLTNDPRVHGFGSARNIRTITSARLVRPLSLRRWSSYIEVTHRVQYSVLAVTFRRLIAAGMDPPDSLRAAFIHVQGLCQHFPHPVVFDRCFEVAALLEGLWGVPAPQLQLTECSKCRAQHLISSTDSGKANCPFCTLVSRHRKLL